MSYFEKYSFTIPSASSAKLGKDATTNIQYGYLQTVTYFPDATNPFVAGSSAFLKIRAGSTTGRLLFMSSSGLANVQKRYYPQAKISESTAGKTVLTSTLGYRAQIPVCQETLYLIRRGSSTGSTQGGTVDIIVGG